VRIDELREALAARGEAAAACTTEADRFYARLSPDLTGGLRDLLEVEGLGDTTELRRRDGTPARLTTADEHLELRLGDRTLELPSELAPALERILKLDSLRPADLDDLLDAPSRLVLLRRLVREGLFTLARDAGADDGGGGSEHG
jgi:bifunctional lysine-specific demethylase and histidyl-hydroxylase NO66